ncbi:MAG: signal peptidase I [Chloroflexi bacterium]|nr:signal peptidase I [Chloroflexota bacterium]MBT4003338.1 signal peptidase I [Chloroflexota bacterium]MBT4305870.1 signal peptidase I [Chloroflexota bacterium]MBT4533695.1 signal peptidase I [Chloroflexota bacterium]MBT4681662.1 signal peptidase I [Chloroflexota bacterium]
MENSKLDNSETKMMDEEELLKINQEKAKLKFRLFIKESLETLLLALILVLIINTISTRIRVEGYSMEPTYHNNNYIVVSKLTYKFKEISRGDVIVFEYPLAPDEDFIKRVIGLPGDEIEVTGGKVYLNGRVLDESYIVAAPIREQPLYVVPEESLFVMGDNRNNSSDSRTWGSLPIENIIGKTVFVYWPISDFGAIDYSEIELIFN